MKKHEVWERELLLIKFDRQRELSDEIIERQRKLIEGTILFIAVDVYINVDIPQGKIFMSVGKYTTSTGQVHMVLPSQVEQQHQCACSLAQSHAVCLWYTSQLT